MKTEHKVIDNFVSEPVFEELRSLIMDKNPVYQNNITWLYNTTIANEKESQDFRYFYMQHMIYATIVMSPLYEKIQPILHDLNVKASIRIKCNLFPYSEKVHEHAMHTDLPYTHKAAILYINTCDGYTKLEDGTKIDSVANRILLFDASKLHCSTTCTDQTARFNINFNYF